MMGDGGHLGAAAAVRTALLPPCLPPAGKFKLWRHEEEAAEGVRKTVAPPSAAVEPADDETVAIGEPAPIAVITCELVHEKFALCECGSSIEVYNMESR